MIKVKAITAILAVTAVITAFAAWLNFKEEVLANEAFIIFSLIPLVLTSGILIKHKVVLVLQWMLIFYALLSYILPLLAIGYYPWYLPTIPKFDSSVSSEVKWALMALGDIAAIQFGLILAGYKDEIISINLERIEVRRAIGIGFILLCITIFFRHGLGLLLSSQVALDNPIIQLTQPHYVIFSLIIYALYCNSQNKAVGSFGLKLLIFAYIIITVISGSRSGLVNVFLLYAAAWMLWFDELRLKHFIGVVTIAIIAILFLVIGSVMRSGMNTSIGDVFFISDNIYDAVAIFAIRRIGLHEGLYQIANALYNPQIYNEIGVLQFLQSTFDLLMPGTYFPGSYSLSALNLVWLSEYKVSEISGDWASIAVGLYAVNYLYFGKIFGWFATALVVYLYAICIVHLISKKHSGWRVYFGIYLLSTFQSNFLTSFGYEYFIRHFVFGAANMYFWNFLTIGSWRYMRGPSSKVSYLEVIEVLEPKH